MPALLIFRVSLALVLAASQAVAAPAFIGVSTIGLEPPPGFVAQEDTFRKGAASIVARAMSAEAYARASADRRRLAAGIVGPEARIAPFSAGGADGFIIRGRKTMEGVDVRVWVVVVGTPTRSAMVGAFVPVADVQTTDEAVEAALRTITFRERPGLEAQIAALPFVVGDPAGFRVASASADAKMLELTDAAEPTGGPRVFVRADTFVTPSDEAVARRFAEQFLWARFRIKPLTTTEPRLYEAIGGRYVELRAEKTDDASHVVTDVAFLVRYDSSGAFDIACTAPHPMASALVERCHTLAFTVRPRL